MFSPLRNRFGIPGVISVIALVFAMLGGAYAASNDGGGKATASAKGKRGPRGPKGATGPAGPAGPAGPQGPAGANGKDGSNGSNGSNGKDGQSVTGTPISTGGACGPNTGVKYTLSATSTNVCNGEDGEDGEPGESPKGHPFAAGSAPSIAHCSGLAGVEYEVESTGDTQFVCNGGKGEKGDSATGPLQPGEQESGIWSVTSPTESGEQWFVISFPRPLQAFVPEEHARVVPASGDGEHCKGSVSEPNPDPNYFCLYVQASSQLTFGEIWDLGFNSVEACGTGGCLVTYTPSAVGARAKGVWAVKK